MEQQALIDEFNSINLIINKLEKLRHPIYPSDLLVRIIRQMFFAHRQNNQEYFAKFMDLYLDALQILPKSLINNRNIELNPLILAIKLRMSRGTTMLLENGADPMTKLYENRMDMNTPLNYLIFSACSSPTQPKLEISIIKFMIGINLIEFNFEENSDHNFILQMIYLLNVYPNNKKIIIGLINLFLIHGANVNVLIRSTNKPLICYAIFYRQLDVVKLLLRHGANAEICSDELIELSSQDPIRKIVEETINLNRTMIFTKSLIKTGRGRTIESLLDDEYLLKDITKFF